MCPVQALRNLMLKGCLSKRKFKKGLKVRAELKSYLTTVTGDNIKKFSPHTLRIGGRT